jgi:hypothetical protein
MIWWYRCKNSPEKEKERQKPDKPKQGLRTIGKNGCGKESLVVSHFSYYLSMQLILLSDIT